LTVELAAESRRVYPAAIKVKLSLRLQPVHFGIRDIATSACFPEQDYSVAGVTTRQSMPKE